MTTIKGLRAKAQQARAAGLHNLADSFDELADRPINMEKDARALKATALARLARSRGRVEPIAARMDAELSA